VARVRQWVTLVLAHEQDALTPEQQLRLTLGIAGDRLDFLYHKAMVGFDSSEGIRETVRTLPSGDTVTTQVTCEGDWRYLFAAGRLAVMRAELSASGVVNNARATDAEITDGPLRRMMTGRTATTWKRTVRETGSGPIDLPISRAQRATEVAARHGLPIHSKRRRAPRGARFSDLFKANRCWRTN
jgi:hypothetical protein